MEPRNLFPKQVEKAPDCSSDDGPCHGAYLTDFHVRRGRVGVLTCELELTFKIESDSAVAHKRGSWAIAAEYYGTQKK